MNHHALFMLMALVAVVLVVSCGGGTATPTTAPVAAATTAPTGIPAPTLAPTQVPATTVPTTAPTQAPVSTVAPTSAPSAVPPTTAPTGAPTQAPAATSGKFGQADLDKIFPPGRGQDLVFRACNNCHNWVPIAIQQPTKEQWGNILKDHRPRVTGLTDEEFDYLSNYLIENFGPQRPVPDNIPPDLLQQWTSY